MGHASSSWWLQSSEYNGTYRNKFKRGGRGVRWTPWKTVDGRCEVTGGMDGAKKMWLEAHQQRDPAKLTRFRVRYKGKVVVNEDGNVYAIEEGRYLRFVESLL
jgi:hypothetical protein